MTLKSDQSNQLVNASSPYLLQHADNPVHWQEWNTPTLNLAQQLNKPILLSVGYAACHWCHVMAHESFEDEETAQLMNQYFVNIKVDREERPDIDQIYMAALHALGEQGGWPLTMFLKPDGSPFWGGTYFPPIPSHGRPAFKQVLKSIHDVFRDKISDVEKNATALTAHLNNLSKPQHDSGFPDPKTFQDFSKRIIEIYDEQYGGIKGAPKFPNAPMLEVWARAASGDANSAYAKAFLNSIRQISLGGIYDHLAGGISRYSVDHKWLVPHFEKMLYDNAHFLRHLLICWQFTNEKLFRTRIEETIAWLENEMLLPQGAFASSLDADSEGEEGKFYVWEKNEIDSLINNKSACEEFCQIYDINSSGNWEGKTILNLSNMDNLEKTFTDKFKKIRNNILIARSKRIRPGQDDKILTDWNGYLIRALAEISIAFQHPKSLELAENAFHFLTESNDNELFHSTRNNHTIKPALASDYAAMLNASLSLYEATYNQEYLDKCKDWFIKLEDDYTDQQGGFYLTSIHASDLLVRPRADQDEANPSASSLILEAMIRYANLSGDFDFHAKAEKLVINQEAISKINKYGMAGYMNGLDSYFNHTHFLVCGPQTDKKTRLAEIVKNLPLPGKTVSIQNSEINTKHNGMEVPSLKGKVYVIACTTQTCSAPLYSIEELEEYLSS